MNFERIVTVLPAGPLKDNAAALLGTHFDSEQHLLLSMEGRERPQIESLLRATFDSLNEENITILCGAIMRAVKSSTGSSGTVLSPQTRFMNLLPFKSEKVVMDTVWQHYSAQMTTVENQEQAVVLYGMARRFPKSSTRTYARDFDIIMNGPLDGAVSAKASFFRAFDSGKPRVAKIYDSQIEAKREMEMVTRAISEDAPFSLMRVKFIELKSQSREAAAIPPSIIIKSGGSSSKSGNIVQLVMIMPLFPSTLRDFPVPVPSKHLLRVAKDVLTGLEYMWSRGFAFCDVKPSNIFLTEDGNGVLGDYGGVTEFDSAPAETTQMYIPSDWPTIVASKRTDSWMLAITILEMASSAQRQLCLPISDAGARFSVSQLDDVEFKEFLMKLINS